MTQEETFMADLKETVKGTARDCKVYGDLCKKQEYDLDKTITDATLQDIPYINWQHFKMSNQLYHELLRIPLDQIAYWTLSSSSTGDPSLVGRVGKDVEVFRDNYRVGFEEYAKMKTLKRLILFAPSLKFLNHVRVKAMEKPGYLFYRDITTIWDGYQTDFLLQFKMLKAIAYMLTHFKLKAFIEINGSAFEKALQSVEKEKTPTLMANSVPLIYTNVMDLIKKRKEEGYAMEPTFRVHTGGGGWSGVKGTVKLENPIDKGEFFEKIGKFFNIPIENFSDTFGATETPICCGGHWSKKYNDIVLHLDKKQARMVIRNTETGERIKTTKEPGLLEVVTPYGVDSYAGVAVLLDDVVEILDFNRCEECGRENLVLFRVVKKYTPESGKGCTSFTVYRPLKTSK
nr:hypothetical protein [Candidatus Sigynarchaeum springense]MDO8119108.1 hypothetical protein [Candidatus Sigynarchaeota archaeon]